MANKRRNYQGEERLVDPFEDQAFDIVEFLAADQGFGNVEEDPNRLHRQPPSQMRHLHHQNVVPDPQHNTNNGMYQMSHNRLPDTPPITEFSGNGSSGSPSSNSDAPFSPDAYPFSVNGNPVNNNGLILGVHDLQPNMMQQEFMARQHANQMNSPPSAACFMSPYPNSQMTPASNAQVSPSPGVCNENYSIRQYNSGQMDLYSMLNGSSEGSIDSQNPDAPMSRKRARVDSQIDKFMPAMGNPMASSPIDGSYPDETYGQQVIKFNQFQEEQWNALYDANGRELKQLQVHVVADKGFNYSSVDNCFVNQKKNHFQISVHVEACDNMPPKNVRYNGVLVPIQDFKLSFCGVKAEMPTSEVCIKQSRTDRKPHPHNPVPFEIQERRMTKVTVPRLHFSETTLNNQRKNYRPNPDQKYFLLVVRLLASVSDDTSILIQSYGSEKVIVRATNPGSFEPPESDVTWARNGNILTSAGPVSVGTDRSFGKLTVDGDIYTTGRVICPSDLRLKEGIAEKEARDALENLCKLRVVDYFYKPEIAEKWGLTEDQRKRTGVIAQELAAVLPDAVKDIGDYLTVNESRVFYETVLATQELCRLTGDLDSKIDEKVEEISQRLARYARHKKLLGSMASNLNGDTRSMLSYSRSSLASTVVDKSRRRSGKRDAPQPLCNSRLTQGTIITLVVVMATCLIGMSALYVLDWHNRNYGYHHVYPAPTAKEEPANMVVPAENRDLPVSQPDAPPLMSKCRSNTCRTYCCSPEKAKFDYSSMDELEDAAGVADHKMIVQRSAPLRGPVGSSFSSGVQIAIPSHNVTIDSRYCIEKSCSRRRGIFNLYIPVSPFLPDAPIEIFFSVPRSKIVNNCGYLSEFQHKDCSTNPNKDPNQYPVSDQITEDMFELSVGSYMQSAYRFRVAHTTEACFANEEHLHSSYEEYNLIFYRTCAAPSADANAEIPPF
ncbi:unnamed protein product [Caenorhabditis auriculariae]|uniref:Uncharacterized protein n=1 Tax=Caenorhabditis auriculariae TaxID=2777116 RepID=A0A8S1HD44_9PELO|nr:unnamed protein product [Caenorhabditis auriculariae]